MQEGQGIYQVFSEGTWSPSPVGRKTVPWAKVSTGCTDLLLTRCP